jgi:hypothetical protein
VEDHYESFKHFSKIMTCFAIQILSILRIMKNTFKALSILPLLLLFITLNSCENGSGQIEQLTQENEALITDFENQLIETKTATQTADSLHTIVNKLRSEVQKMKGEMPSYKASNEDEKAIEALVSNMHQGWATMAKTKDTNALIQYFLPKYTASAVRVNTENLPSVNRSNDANFEEHLRELIGTDNLSISFGQTKFLYTEVKGDFFVTSYRTRIRVYRNNDEVHSSSLVTLLAGQKKDEWKVGNYNWVTFNY